jgi:hypothetical protein
MEVKVTRDVFPGLYGRLLDRVRLHICREREKIHIERGTERQDTYRERHGKRQATYI